MQSASAIDAKKMGDGDNKEKGGIMVGIKRAPARPGTSACLPCRRAAVAVADPQDAEAARYVGDRLGEAFNIEDHAAILLIYMLLRTG